MQEVKTDNFPGNSISQPITFTKSTSFTVFGLVGDFCPVANGTLLEWRIRDLDSVDDTGVIVSSGDSDWTIQKQSLPIGFYLIEFRATLLNATNVTSRDYTYVKIKGLTTGCKGSLEDRLYCRDMTRSLPWMPHSLTTPILLSETIQIWNSHGYVKSRMKHIRRILSYRPTTCLWIYMADSKSQGLGGCFGTGIGRLNSTEHVVKV